MTASFFREELAVSVQCVKKQSRDFFRILAMKNEVNILAAG